MNLADLQSALQAHILTSEPAIVGQVRAASGDAAQLRLGIYRDGYRLRLLEVMRDHFTHTHTYLGDALFESEALAYIEAHSSGSRSLRHYGAHWPQWLAQRYPDDLDMADLSALEWALRDAFDGADRTPLTMTDLATLGADAWATLGFELHPTWRQLPHTHNVIDTWHALSAGDAPPQAETRPGTLSVWRLGWQPHFRSLSPAEAKALSNLASGRSFAQLCGEVDAPDEAAQAAQAGQWLMQWVNEGLLVAVRLDPDR